MKKPIILVLITLLLTGCSTIHSHKYSQANYQQPSTCSECGNIKGTVLLADFDKYRISEFAKLDEVYEYTTICSDKDEEGNIFYTTATVQFSNDSILEADSSHEEKKGYIWRHVEMKLVFSDENSINYGMTYSYLTTNFFDIETYQNSYQFNEEKSKNMFTVNYNGVDYNECVAEVLVNNTEWSKTNGKYSKTITISFNFQLPAGYDGMVVGVRNSDLDISNYSYFNQYYNSENFILYRVKGE